MTETPRKRGRPSKPKYTVWKGLKREWIRMAEDRTDFLLLLHPLSVLPLKSLLANAYLQGLADCAEVAADMLHRRDMAAEAAVEQKTTTVPEGLG